MSAEVHVLHRQRKGYKSPVAIAGATSHSDLKTQLEEWAYDSSVPAACEHECTIEPDGECGHGFPSVLRDMGLI